MKQKEEINSEYTVSQKEMKRRLAAFKRMIGSFFAGLVLFSGGYRAEYGNELLLVYLVVAFLLGVSLYFTERGIKNFSKIVFLIFDDRFERITVHSRETYYFSDIVKLSVKHTKANSVREIGIFFRQKNSIFVNGLNDFEQFEKMLLEKCGDTVNLQRKNEPIDYDHPLFYVFFGFVVSFILVNAIQFLQQAGSRIQNYLWYGVLVYNYSIALYLFAVKPVAKRFGRDSHKGDYIGGFIILVVTTGLLFWQR